MWKNTEYDFQWLLIITGVIALIIGYTSDNILFEALFVPYGWASVILNLLVIVYFWRRKKYGSK